MGKFIVDRESNYMGAAAKYDIYLDGKKLDYINNGSVKEYVVENGKHELYMQNGLISFGFKSKPVTFEARDDVDVKIICKSTMGNMAGIKLEVQTKSNGNPVSESPSLDKYEDLERIASLKKQGILSEEEYEIEKAKILGGN